MKPAPKFGKRPSPAKQREAADMADAIAIVRLWAGGTLPADTVNRLAAGIARRVA